ncbi:MAG: glutathione S-transferase family protein [Azospirillaceae bacterium]
MRYTLFYFPGNANIAPHVALEEIGADYRLELVDRPGNAHKSEAYLKLNPNGRLPTLIDHDLGDLVIFEAAAICLHLNDRHPEAGLLPPAGTAERAIAYQWLIWLTNTLQTDTLAFFYARRFLGLPEGEIADAVKAGYQARLAGWYKIAADGLAASGGPYFLGERYTIADAYLAMICRWGRVLATPPRSLGPIDRLLAAVEQRPAVRRAYEMEGVPEPWFDAA